MSKYLNTNDNVVIKAASLSAFFSCRNPDIAECTKSDCMYHHRFCKMIKSYTSDDVKQVFFEGDFWIVVLKNDFDCCSFENGSVQMVKAKLISLQRGYVYGSRRHQSIQRETSSDGVAHVEKLGNSYKVINFVANN